jgi:hypothetical protein
VDTGSAAGGILKLRELIAEHPAEFAYDFRSRFGVSYEAIGYDISYREALALVAVLLKDPTSWLQAAENKWRFPASQEWIMLVQQFDAFVMANSKNRPQPTKMPWDNPVRSGKPAISQDRVREILDAMRPKENDG